MMAGFCLLALVLTFTIAECGSSQEKRQEPPQDPCQACMEHCKAMDPASFGTCRQFCCSGQGGAAPGSGPGGGPDGPDYDNGSDDGNGPNDGNGSNDSNHYGSDDGNGSDDNNGSDDGNGSGSGAAVAGATIFSTISALLVAVASAMN